MKQQIFGRAVPANAVGEVDFEAADAADALDARKLLFAGAQRQRDVDAVGDVAYRDADAVAIGEGAKLAEAIWPQRRIALEILRGAHRHHAAVSPFEFGAGDIRREIP